MPLITCRDVSFAYENGVVLQGVNFSLKQGGYLSIVGENGAGKSTLIKGLLGLLRPVRGEILFGDGLLKKEIGYLPQQTAAQKDFPASVLEVVLSGRLNSSGLRPFYTKRDKEIALRTIQMFGMQEFLNHCYRELSGGQQQRVLLARALCATKKLLLLDEPSAGLDPAAQTALYETIKAINQTENIAIVMVSHDIQNAVKYAETILHLANEQLFFGTTEEYAVSEAGEKFLGGRV